MTDQSLTVTNTSGDAIVAIMLDSVYSVRTKRA